MWELLRYFQISAAKLQQSKWGFVRTLRSHHDVKGGINWFYL